MKHLPAACFVFFAVLLPSLLFAQDGKIIFRVSYKIADSVKQFRVKNLPSYQKIYDSTEVQQIKYLSDALKIAGFIAQPKKAGKYPCIIFCRGGYAAFSMLDDWSCSLISEIASHGYVVIASQYRGSPGSEGKDEIGGDDVHDVLNCIPVLAQLPNADTSRVGMWGVSRGGMMVYEALTSLKNIKAAFINSGSADEFDAFKRPDSANFEEIFKEQIPGYPDNKDASLTKRSAICFADKICRATPLLIMQGSGDWRVIADGTLKLVSRLYALHQPMRFILFEGGEHGLRSFPEKNQWTWDWFDKYVKNKSPLPDMEMHDQ